MRAHRYAVAHYVEFESLKSTTLRPDRVRDPRISDIPFLGDRPVEHRCPGRDIAQTIGTTWPTRWSESRNPSPVMLRQIREQFLDERVHRRASPSGAVYPELTRIPL
jgi:hypothetical protein